MVSDRISQLGDYTILKQLGNGSLGLSFLAEHAFLKKHYVIKILPEELTKDVDFLSKFPIKFIEIIVIRF